MSIGFKKVDQNFDCRYEMLKQQPSVPEYIDVIGSVFDKAAWKSLPGIRHGATIFNQERGTYIVTATIPFEKFYEINNLPFVKTLEISPHLRRM